MGEQAGERDHAPGRLNAGEVSETGSELQVETASRHDRLHLPRRRSRKAAHEGHDVDRRPGADRGVLRHGHVGIATGVATDPWKADQRIADVVGRRVPSQLVREVELADGIRIREPEVLVIRHHERLACAVVLQSKRGAEDRQDVEEASVDADLGDVLLGQRALELDRVEGVVRVGWIGGRDADVAG